MSEASDLTNRISRRYIAKEGLKKMKRNHVHCATGLAGEDGVKSGEWSDGNCEGSARIAAELDA